MNMAKASTTDLDLAQNIARIIEDLEKGFMPNADDSEDIVWFDIDSHDDCKHVIKAILNEANRGSLFRVTFGMLVLCDPENTLLKPDSDILEPHPLISEMESDLQRETEAARYWNMRYHQMVQKLAQAEQKYIGLAIAYEEVESFFKKEREIDRSEKEYVQQENFKLRQKCQSEHIETNRWKNRAELAEARIKLAQEQQPIYMWRLEDDGWMECTKEWFDAEISAGYEKRIVYTNPIPTQSHDVEREELIRLIEAVRKWGIDHTGCEPSISCFHQAVDNLRMALDNPPAVAVPDDNPNEWIIEKLSYHKLERNDLNIDGCLNYLESEWKEIQGRTTRQLVMQILELLAAAPSPRITERHSKGIEYVKSCVLANSASAVREELLVILDEYIKLQQPKEKIAYEICSLWRHSSDKFCIQFGDRSGLYVSEKILLTNVGATAIASAVKFYGLLEDSSKSEPSELVKESSAPYPHPRISEQDARTILESAISVLTDPEQFSFHAWHHYTGHAVLEKLNGDRNEI